MNSRRCFAVLLSVAIGLGVAACTRGPAPSAAPSAPSAPSTLTSAPTVSPSASASPVPLPGPGVSSPSQPLPGEMTLLGVVQAGEQPGCVFLIATDSKVYVLLGGDRQIIVAGTLLEVTGKVVPGLLNSTCRDGIPFQVTSVRRD